MRTAAFVAALTLSVGAPVPTVMAVMLPEVRAVLAYDGSRTDEADAFFEALSLRNGEVIRLRLEVIPGRGDEAGYILTVDSDEDVTQSVVCGQEYYGLVDNHRTDFALLLGHPEHFHVSVGIHVGNRLDYPLHTLVCGLEDYTSEERTHLHVSGHFVVARADVPTSVQFVLYPYDP